MHIDAKVTHGRELYLATWGGRYPHAFLLALGRFLTYVCKLQWTEACLSTASTFYSACGYAVREKTGIKKKLLILVGGSGAVIFALLAVWGKFFSTPIAKKTLWDNFNPNELDVLGSIFSQAKFFNFAHYCYRAIGRQSYVHDSTVALSCKWYAKNPRVTLGGVEMLKQKVVRLINSHPEWDETLLARLYDFIGEERKAIEARREIARKVAEGTL